MLSGLFLRPPDAAAIERFRCQQSDCSLTYAFEGLTREFSEGDPLPDGFVLDCNRGRVGSGGAVFRTACLALRSWKHFQLGWVNPVPVDLPVQPGEVIAVKASVAGVQLLNACRIVYLVDDRPESEFGFAYGTLPGHAERGEERFMVRREEDDSVWYEILALSRPARWFTRLGYPITRRMQRRFARDSIAAMQRACSVEK